MPMEQAHRMRIELPTRRVSKKSTTRSARCPPGRQNPQEHVHRESASEGVKAKDGGVGEGDPAQHPGSAAGTEPRPVADGSVPVEDDRRNGEARHVETEEQAKARRAAVQIPQPIGVVEPIAEPGKADK